MKTRPNAILTTFAGSTFLSHYPPHMSFISALSQQIGYVGNLSRIFTVSALIALQLSLIALGAHSEETPISPAISPILNQSVANPQIVPLSPGPTTIPTPGANTGAASPTSTTEAPSNYRLRPGDLVAFAVFNQPDLSVSARIVEGGSLNVPLIGEVEHPVGRPVGELCAEIKRRLEADFLRQATVQATIVEYAPLLVSLTGSVARQGDIKLSPFQITTAMQAIASAGGFLADADLKNVVVIRTNASGQVSLPVRGALDPTSDQPDINLEAGDRIHVPKQELHYFFMVGKIKLAGMHPLPYGQAVTVTKAITMAGGFDTFARQDRVQVLRQGKVVSEVNVRALLDGKASGTALDPLVNPGDTINVSDSRY